MGNHQSNWDKSLETGNELIDSQHRQIIKLNDSFIEFGDKSYDEVLSILARLLEFTQDHFLSEEKLMAQVRYPSDVTKEMVDQHQEFKSFARLRYIEFRRNKLIKMFSLESFILPLQSFLDHWLKVHEFGLDRKLADWIRKEKASATSQVA